MLKIRHFEAEFVNEHPRPRLARRFSAAIGERERPFEPSSPANEPERRRDRTNVVNRGCWLASLTTHPDRPVDRGDRALERRTHAEFGQRARQVSEGDPVALNDVCPIVCSRPVLHIRDASCGSVVPTERIHHHSLLIT